MMISATRASLQAIEPMRVLFLHEANCQFVHDKCHRYGWADTWLLQVDGRPVGYGSVWGKENRSDRDSIFEFYVLPTHRRQARECFEALRTAAQTPYIECQTNDRLITSMLYEQATNIYAEAILFEDQYQTGFPLGNLLFQPAVASEGGSPYDRPFVLVEQDEVVANGGLMLNYNSPYADIYYDVPESQRRKGFGTLMVQELKKAAYAMNLIPAARCNIRNMVSKATLLKGGFRVCGHILQGELH